MRKNKACSVCGIDGLKTIFKGKIRDGSYGNLTSSDYKVFQCCNCKVRFLDKFSNKEMYESDDYREQYCDSIELEDFWTAHDELCRNKLHRVGIHNCRNKIVADYGAGGGSFLDTLQGFARETIAIEPTKNWHEEISKKHQVFSYSRELIETGIKVDIGISFDVIEHVSDPESYLKEIKGSLAEKGKLFLITPNFHEILFDLVKEKFEPFNYRTAHSYYFCEDSMRFLFERVGFKKLEVGFYHEMDISNLIHWLKDGKPTGKNKNKMFDDDANRHFCSYLEKIGKSSHLWVEAQK